mgnify:CR=1 FL=1
METRRVEQRASARWRRASERVESEKKERRDLFRYFFEKPTCSTTSSLPVFLSLTLRKTKLYT